MNTSKLTKIEDISIETQLNFKKDFDIEILIDLKKREIDKFIKNIEDEIKKTS